MLPRWLLLAGVAMGLTSADFVVYPDTYCGVGTGGIGELNSCTCSQKNGACMKAPGHTASGTNYGYMGSISLEACEAKCLEVSCRCFDYSPIGNGRPDENCRICKSTSSFLPLSPSGAKYSAHIYQRPWGWSVAGPILGFAAAYLVIGSLHGKLVKGRLGWQVLPHLTFWSELRGLVEDGVQFSLSGGGRRGSQQQRKKARDALLPPGSQIVALASDAHKEGKGKKDKKDKKDKRSTSDSRSSTTDPVAASATAVGGGTAGEGGGGGNSASSVSTASGSGGRWVHIPG